MSDEIVTATKIAEPQPLTVDSAKTTTTPFSFSESNGPSTAGSNSMARLLAQGPDTIQQLATANGHGIPNVQIMSESRAAHLVASKQILSPMDAQELIAPTHQQQIVIVRGKILLDSMTCSKVTVVETNSSVSKGGFPMHTVVDNRSGKRYKVSQRKLLPL